VAAPSTWIAARTLAASLLLLLNAAVPAQSPAPPATRIDAPAEARALFDDVWETALRESPELATFVGDPRYADRLADLSPAAAERRRGQRSAFLERAKRLDTATLSVEDRVSLRVLRHQLEQSVALDRLCAPVSCVPPDFWSPVTQFDGLQFLLPRLVDATRFATARDYDAYLARLAALPTRVDKLIVAMEAAMKLGWMPAQVAITRVPEQLDAQLDSDPAKSPEYAPFKAFPPDVPAAERERLAAAGRRVIEVAVIPSFRRLRDFYVQRYLPAAAKDIAASALPPGPRYYEARLAFYTTTRMTPREVHDLGLAEVARIGREMDATVKAAGFAGTRAEFQKWLNTDPQFFYTRAEDMLAGYRDIAKRADAILPRYFAVLPRLPYGVRAMRPEEGDNAEHYVRGSIEAGRAGYFEANVNSLSRRPKWTMETLLLHEAVPGHHLQIARAQELDRLPRFRRNAFFVAFSEGWALYAESLGYEMGFYADPYSRFGNLAAEMHRAARLVVDTGIHAFGWSRARAIDYLIDEAALTPEFATAEVDRYIVTPGQATAYKIGELRIKALRAKAKAALGETFDLRRFHNAVIDHGAVPLDVLESQIDDWIAEEKGRKP
jgi:uncharacterized protein (DUF885 family)